MDTQLPAAAVMNSAPCPAFDRIAAAGYTLAYRMSDGTGTGDDRPPPGTRELFVWAHYGGVTVAKANFTDDGPGAYCQNVEVATGHRRRGLADAVYVLAEVILGKPLWDFWKGDRCQSEGAKALWNRPDRPFGNRRPTTGPETCGSTGGG